MHEETCLLSWLFSSTQKKRIFVFLRSELKKNSFDFKFHFNSSFKLIKTELTFHWLLHEPVRDHFYSHLHTCCKKGFLEYIYNMNA